jgi:hypothetical protein
MGRVLKQVVAAVGKRIQSGATRPNDEPFRTMVMIVVKSSTSHTGMACRKNAVLSRVLIASVIPQNYTCFVLIKTYLSGEAFVAQPTDFLILTSQSPGTLFPTESPLMKGFCFVLYVS